MTLEPGELRFHDAARPTVPAGDYVVRMEQTVTQGGAVAPVERRIRVTAPRFALPGTEVQSVFPPPNAEGSFETRLAQVVLKRRTLPWERRIDGAGAEPWIALVLLTAAEATLRRDVPVTEVVPASKHAELGITAADGHCDCIETTASVVQAVFPRRGELPWLAHVREASLRDTELAGGDLDGFFAVVVSSRLPRAGLTYGAYLVSLEGRGDVLPTGTTPPTTEVGAAEATATGPADLRFPILAHWSFTCAGEGDFESLMGGLHVGSLGTAPSGCPGVTPTGHVAVAHRSRRGEKRAAWYRGPLTPRHVERQQRPPYAVADQARRVASDGLEDLSEAAAFEVGRLLAMSDPQFLAALSQWRRAVLAEDFAAQALAAFPGLTDRSLPGAARAAALVALDALTSPDRPLGAAVPLKDLTGVLHRDDHRVIADGFRLDRSAVEQALTATALSADIDLPRAQPVNRLETTFDALVGDPSQLSHLRQALGERVAHLSRYAGLDPDRDAFDPARAPRTVDELYGGTP